LNSQYWFIITFDFGAIGIVPVFQYTVQINPIYAASFSTTDLIQKIYRTIDPVNYVTIPTNTASTPPAKATPTATTENVAPMKFQPTGTGSLSLSTASASNTTTSTTPSTATAPTPAAAPVATVQLISKGGAISTIGQPTVNALFG